jgi:hypothetical protein
MKKLYIFLFVALVLVLAGFSLTASASSFSSGVFGNNYYQFVEVTDPYTSENNAWWTAESATENSFYNGVYGHLATITSQGENDFLLSLVPEITGFAGAWIGGKAGEGWLTGPENGEAFTYSYWGYPEPNNNGYAYMSIGDGVTVYARGLWVDDSDAGSKQGVPYQGADPVMGYFVEYENAATVPIPAALWLLGSGIAAIIGIRRKVVNG